MKAKFMIVASLALICFSCEEKSDFVLDEGITRDELVSMDYHRKTEEYNNLSPEAKYSLWRYKLRDNIKSPTLSCKEKLAMKHILSLIDPCCFSSETDSVRMGKINKTVDELCWPEEKKFLYLERFETIEELNASKYLSTEKNKFLLNNSSEDVSFNLMFFSNCIDVDEDGCYFVSVSEKEAKSQGIKAETFRKVQKALNDKEFYESDIDKSALLQKLLLE